MASDYGLNFGVRAADETVAVTEGRYKTPTGAALKQGSLVMVDHAATDDRVKAADANTQLQPRNSGVLISEEVWERSIYEAQLLDSYDLGVAKADRRCVILTGSGVKLWYRNTTGSTRADGRVIPTVALMDLTSCASGDTVGWNGTKWVKSGSGVPASAVLSNVSADLSYAELTLLV